MNGRDIKKIVCSCGTEGGVREVETTDEEEKEYGCYHIGCCVVVYLCVDCNTRWTFALEAPDSDLRG